MIVRFDHLIVPSQNWSQLCDIACQVVSQIDDIDAMIASAHVQLRVVIDGRGVDLEITSAHRFDAIESMSKFEVSE